MGNINNNQEEALGYIYLKIQAKNIILLEIFTLMLLL